jgi:hypothetical protein
MYNLMTDYKDSIQYNFSKECVREEHVDIHEHLFTLYEYAKQCNSIIECGVRQAVSSYAFALGLKGTPNNSLRLIDIDYRTDSIDTFLRRAAQESVNATFTHESDLICERTYTDMVFIDTWHIYGQLKRELSYWNEYARKYIIMHDTTVDGIYGETIRGGQNPFPQSLESGFPVEEITKGLWPAIEEFLVAHPEWILEKRYTNCNGLTILKRI